MVGQKIEETFVQQKKRPAGGALLQDAGHKGGGRQLAGGVVGLAEEHHVHAVIDGVAEGLRHCEVVGLPQKTALHRAADRFQCGGIFRKGGGRDQRLAGALGPHQPEDQVRRAVAAEELFRRNALVCGQLFPQGAAKRVRVAVRRGKGCGDGLGHPLRQAQRADVGRKIQRVAAKLGAVARPVAAMYELHGNISFRNA